MSKYRIIYVVLVYKRTDILKGFFESLKEQSECKVILVNSFYDDISKKECLGYAKRFNADFIDIPNKGYSYGNNIGIQYAIDHYMFDYLIVSNSDIIVKKMSLDDSIYCNKKYIIAPDTIMLTGKRQNPNISYKSLLFFKLLRKGYAHDSQLYLYMAHIFSRVSRELTILLSILTLKKRKQIFGVHGSFFIITREALIDMMPLFNDSMFLYNEELYLAYKSAYHKIPVVWDRTLSVTHLEGASSSSDNTISYKYNKDSFKKIEEYVMSKRLL